MPSTLHRYLKYLHKGAIHYIIGDPNPFNHCNFAFSLDSHQMPCGHLFSITILVNDHPNPTSSHPLEPSYFNPSSFQSIASS